MKHSNQSNNSVAPAILNSIVDDETINFFLRISEILLREKKKETMRLKRWFNLENWKPHTLMNTRMNIQSNQIEYMPACMLLRRFTVGDEITEVWVANNTKHCKFWARIFCSDAIMHKAKESTKSEKHSLMRTILWGSEKIEDTFSESLIGECKDIKECWIDL